MHINFHTHSLHLSGAVSPTLLAMLMKHNHYFFHKLSFDFRITLQVYPLILFLRLRFFSGLKAKERKHANQATSGKQGRICLCPQSFFLMGIKSKSIMYQDTPKRGVKGKAEPTTHMKQVSPLLPWKPTCACHGCSQQLHRQLLAHSRTGAWLWAGPALWRGCSWVW